MRAIVINKSAMRACGFLGILSAVSMCSPVFYRAIPLPTLGGSFVTPLAINASGQITGSSATSSGVEHAFLYSAGAVSDLGTLGAGISRGEGINDRGEITGFSDVPNKSWSHAFVYTNGHMADLGTLGGSQGSSGNGINNSGQITGAADTSGAKTHAFVFTNGHMTDIDTLGSDTTVGNAINSSGQVTGYLVLADDTSHTFLYRNGSMMDLGTLGGADSQGYSINDAGQITGWSNTSNFELHAFLYSNGHMGDLGTLGGTVSIAYGINNHGQIVGNSYTANNTAQDAFFYSDGTMYDLNRLLVNGLRPGEYLDNAWAINTNGWIVAGVQMGGGGYLLEPASTVSEPKVTGLLELGLIACACLRLRKRPLWAVVRQRREFNFESSCCSSGKAPYSA